MTSSPQSSQQPEPESVNHSSEAQSGSFTSGVLFGLARAVGHTAGYFTAKAEQATEAANTAATSTKTAALTVANSAHDRIATSAMAKELLDEGGQEIEDLLLAKTAAREAVHAQRQLLEFLAEVVVKLRDAEAKCNNMKTSSDTSLQLQELAQGYRAFANAADTLLEISSEVREPMISPVEADAICILKSKLRARWAGDVAKWGSQKIPEIAEMNMSDVIMTKAIADVHRFSTSVEHIFVSHKDLKAIHLIDRDTAIQKCEERATSIRDALPLIEKNGMRLSEALIASAPELHSFQSVTGFQVVQLVPEGVYVTFEGNGRRESLKRAFDNKTDIDVQVEVRLYKFSDELIAKRISDQMKTCREWKCVED